MSPLKEHQLSWQSPLQLLLVGAVAVAVTACSAGDSPSSGAATTSAATTPAPVTTTPAPDPVDVLTSAIKKTEEESFRFSASVQEAGQAVKVLGTFDAPRSAYAAAVTVQGEPVEFRVIKDTVYMSSPQLTKGKWARFDNNAAGTPFAPLVAGLAAATDQSEALTAVKKAKNLRKVGTETLGEVQTTKYAATVKGLKGMPAGKAMGLVWWVDEQGRLARATATLDGKLISDGRYSDYGTASVSAPPATEVVDGKSLLGGG
ncbi:MAG TPA: hypothetical protein VEL73_01860 [Mycobacteriales bacterium]|nr:hypothetical protein [Mycobacteriales bacterium]